MNRTEYQRKYMRDWRSKNPTSRVGKLEAALREIAATTQEAETRRMAEEAIGG